MVKIIYDQFIKGAETQKGGLDFDLAFKCVDRINRELNEPRISKEQFVDIYAKLDYDGDEEVSLEEMKEYVIDNLD